MNKAELIEKAVELGLDATGTKTAIKERLEAYRLTPKPVTSEVFEELPQRKKYRMGAHKPKARKNPRNLQVKS